MSTRYVKALPAGSIYEFEDIYEKPHGQHGKDTVYFGERDAQVPEINPTSVCVRIVGAQHIVDYSRFDASASISMAGDRYLILSKHPYAQLGDEGNIQERIYLDSSGSKHINTYTGEDGKDPSPPMGHDGYRHDRDPTWDIPPGHVRYITLTRMKLNPDGTHFPFKITSITKSHDDEVLPIAPPVITESIEMTIGGVKGVFTAY